MTNNKYKDSLKKEMDRLSSLIEEKKKEFDFERAKATDPTVQAKIFKSKEQIKSLQRKLALEDKKAHDKDLVIMDSIKQEIETEQERLKGLIRSQYNETTTKLKNELNILEKRYDNLACKVDFVKDNVEDYQEPYISDHALLRYLERVEGIDIEGLRANLLTEELKATMRFAKNCEIKKKGYKWIVKNMVAITLLKHK